MYLRVVPCLFDGAQESRLFRNKSDPEVLSVRNADAQTPAEPREARHSAPARFAVRLLPK